MAERRKKQKRKDEGESEKPTKEEYAVGKYLRFNVPCKEGKLMGMDVKYFIAKDAVDKLLDSKWTKGDDALFTTRESCVDYCHNLLMKGMFHRAAKVEKKDKKKKKKALESGEDTGLDEEKKSKKKGKKEAEEDKEGKKGEKEKTEESKSSKKKKKAEKEEKEEKEKKKDGEKEKKKKERIIKLHVDDIDQMFLDGDEMYVWVYDPVSPKTFIIGLLLGEFRKHSSLVLRAILFGIIWAVTFGHHHLWILPNLTEDVGFFDSFKPLYTYEYRPAVKTGDSDGKKEQKDKSKEKESDKKTEKKKKEKSSDKEEESEADSKKIDGAGSNEEPEEESGSGSEGKENGFEVVDKEEVTDSDKE
ncbi:translocation protein SEC62-like [Lingula anatina]|uniref:Translocation protein SEC62 n=1 Tax=Lingula anatina TaxID=7574 RepID=A0A1S3HQA2_LINAN|nr:translocation protein SEC62-like [Lingula anatina]|eukprot:XP_013388217.1 translocation protein SEC62-like [Lingula anatina]